MRLLDARFAKLNFDYDRARALAEAVSLVPRLEWTKSAPGVTHVPIPFTVSSLDLGRSDQLSTWYTWKSIGLTHIPGNELSKLGRGTTRNRNVHATWVWRDDVDTPYLKSLCESLPFERITCVRLIVLPPGNTGAVHNDDPLNLYYSSGARSMTLNLASGGQRLEFMHEGKHYTISDYPAFIFRDDCFHGVPQVDEMRVQLRVNGFFRNEMEDLIDKSAVLL